MHNSVTLSSKDIIENLLAAPKPTCINEQQVDAMKREIEQKMDEFDIKERERTARVAEDLSKIVITA